MPTRTTTGPGRPAKPESPGGRVLYSTATALEPLVASTTTAADGTYSFANLAPGTYSVVEGAVAGYLPDVTNTGSLAGIAVTAGSEHPEQQLRRDPSRHDHRHRLRRRQQQRHQGRDREGDRRDRRHADHHRERQDTTVATTTTVADGSYSFTNLAPGTYSVVEGAVTGYLADVTNTGSLAGITVTQGATNAEQQLRRGPAGLDRGRRLRRQDRRRPVQRRHRPAGRDRPARQQQRRRGRHHDQRQGRVVLVLQPRAGHLHRPGNRPDRLRPDRPELAGLHGPADLRAERHRRQLRQLPDRPAAARSATSATPTSARAASRPSPAWAGTPTRGTRSRSTSPSAGPRRRP